MSEEVKESDSTSLKKIIIGGIGTIVTAGAVWISTTLFGGHEEKKEPEKVQTPTIVINNNQQNSTPEKTVIVKEKPVVIKVKETPKKDTGWETSEPKW